MVDPDEENQRSNNRWPVDFSGLFEARPMSLPDFTTLQEEVTLLVHDAKPNSDSEKIEAALSDIEAPSLEDAHLTASTLSDTTPLSSEEADRTIEAGGDAVSFSIEAGEETANVLLDAGDEAIEVVIDGGSEEAAEAVAEVLIAALE
jgi:hypothetical protein